MSKIVKLREIDCIFLSYDEPNAEYNYADLLSKAPWAKRVHGVKGSDAAHKACADISDTEHFITVDGDNIVDPEIFRLDFDFDNFSTKEKSQLSWSGKNYINNLVYGNGGLKCWTREHVWNMRTHEAAQDATNQVDFCWDKHYYHMAGCYSVIHNNASALQAFRAGFREGVKMSLSNGVKLPLMEHLSFKQLIPEQNYQRLLVWCSVGKDVKNGEWAMYGARLGCYMTNCTNWDYTKVRDFDYLNQLFLEQDLSNDKEITETLKKKLQLPIAALDAEQSLFFKTTYQNMRRSSKVIEFADQYTTQLNQDENYDIVFISNNEPHAEENFLRLQKIVKHKNKIHRVQNVRGIYQAHQAAAKIAKSKMFFVVDADAWIVDTFEFNINPTNISKTYIFCSINPLNNLCYGYGGVKLFPKNVFEHNLDSYVDMTTSLAEVKVLPIISCITKFNTTEFDTWRSAFRECVKLSSKIIAEQQDDETVQRLETWVSTATGVYADFCIKGAIAGKEFGETNKNNPESLSLINDYDYLAQMFRQS